MFYWTQAQTPSVQTHGIIWQQRAEHVMMRGIQRRSFCPRPDTDTYKQGPLLIVNTLKDLVTHLMCLWKGNEQCLTCFRLNVPSVSAPNTLQCTLLTYIPPFVQSMI